MADSGPEVGLVGLGIMGSAIGALLAGSGACVYGYDIDEARTRQLAQAGGRVAGSPAEVAARCPVGFTRGGCAAETPGSSKAMSSNAIQPRQIRMDFFMGKWEEVGINSGGEAPRSSLNDTFVTKLSTRY